MVAISILFGALVGTVAAVLQLTLFGASFGTAALTYFAISFGAMIIAVGARLARPTPTDNPQLLAQWVEWNEHEDWAERIGNSTPRQNSDNRAA